jgi:hydrogenase-4 membrane subunit HyfE
MIQFAIILFGVTMLYVASTSRLEAYIKAIAVQGIILFFLVLSDAGHSPLLTVLFLSIETIGVKAVLIPLFLSTIVRKSGTLREVEPYIPNFFSLLITSLIFALGFYIAYWSGDSVNNIRTFYFGISISTIISGMLSLFAQKIITHVMGYMFVENGISCSRFYRKEMPFIVALACCSISSSPFTCSASL